MIGRVLRLSSPPYGTPGRIVAPFGRRLLTRPAVIRRKSTADVRNLSFKELQSDFWATNPHDLKTFLELYLEDGHGQLPKAKLCKLFESALPFHSEGQKAPSRPEIEKSAAGAAIICSAAISS